MKRFIDGQLVAWRNAVGRKPLILRGARQVGKTFSAEAFGREHFGNVVRVDLARNRDMHRLFAERLAPGDILPHLEVFARTRITATKDR